VTDALGYRFYTGDGAGWVSRLNITGNAALADIYTIDSRLLIGDTANTKMSSGGITINQGEADDEILAFKSSVVGHGITQWAETDTYAQFLKTTSANGGLQVLGYTASNLALQLVGLANTSDTTKSSLGQGYVNIIAAKADGADIDTPASNENILAVQKWNTGNHTSVWLCDNEGDTHQDGDIMPFDPSAQDIGSSSFPWANVYSDTISAGDVTADTFTVAGNAGVTGFFDDGTNFRITVTEGLITTIGASVSGGYQIG
jgi:hypothetical protein